jgi:hypothetical protein
MRISSSLQDLGGKTCREAERARETAVRSDRQPDWSDDIVSLMQMQYHEQ